MTLLATLIAASTPFVLRYAEPADLWNEAFHPCVVRGTGSAYPHGYVPPLVANGDLETADAVAGTVGTMVGRAFIRALGERDDIGELLDGYVAASAAELCGERPVLGRLKELLGYWKDSPRWRRRWQVAKMARSLAEIRVW